MKSVSQSLSTWKSLNPTGDEFAHIEPSPERTSIQVTMIRVLEYLAKNSSEDVAGFTQHHLMTIEGLPTQNWTRFRKMLKHLISVGLVEQYHGSVLNLFKITQKGQELVRSGLLLLDEQIPYASNAISKGET